MKTANKTASFKRRTKTAELSRKNVPL
uniref:Uncharacterized protein n=1 Tax=Tetranychus urticae TaxID=32264 RepID=T1JR12_TETUR